MILPHADKNFGQHFLNDSSAIEQITANFIDKASALIEVGPGPGVLTERLIKHQLPLVVVEKDLRFTERLNDILSSPQIVLQDALTVDFKQLITEHFSDSELLNIWLVSNLPYNVSVPLTIEFIKTAPIKLMTLMFQKEVADKIINQKKKKTDNNSLHMLCTTFFDIELLCDLAPSSFTPPPKVNSSVLSFTRKSITPIPLSEFKPFERFLRNLFQNKRKQIFKVLKQSYNSELITSALELASIERTLRAERLEREQVYTLYRKIVTE